jgi:hypothetical protein
MSEVMRSCFLAFLCVGLAGCVSRSVQLVHPQSGATARCSAAGTGILAGAVDAVVDPCVKEYRGRGYVPETELTPEQRADLERRGLLTKPEKPPRMAY